jgi:methyl-accepting chemotaxis protein
LFSVVHALYAFTGVASVDRLVSDFSVALLTTLVGIVGRVLLYEKHASQKSPAEIDDELARLQTEIKGAVLQMQEFRRGLALYLQQATDSAVQGVSTAFTSLSASANQMSEAAKAMNTSLKKGASAFDKNFERIGDASDALGARVSELLEGTTALGSVSEVLNRQIGSMNASLDQQSKGLSSTLAAQSETLEAQSETTRRIRAELESLRTPVSLLARSMNVMREQVDAAKQEFTSAPLRTSIADAREAAESLGRNLRSAADAVSPASVDGNVSVLKKFADAITDLTAKVEDCTRNLASFAERPDQRW